MKNIISYLKSWFGLTAEKSVDNAEVLKEVISVPIETEVKEQEIKLPQQTTYECLMSARNKIANPEHFTQKYFYGESKSGGQAKSTTPLEEISRYSALGSICKSIRAHDNMILPLMISYHKLLNIAFNCQFPAFWVNKANKISHQEVLDGFDRAIACAEEYDRKGCLS